MANVKPVPEGYHTMTPYLSVTDGVQALEFYTKAFGAKELFRMPGENGKGIMHAEMQIGDSRFMLSDESPEMGFRAPSALGAKSVMLHLYVEDVDAAFDRAVKAGAKVLRPVENQFYGDRSGGVEDPFGHAWHLATQVEQLTEAEILERAKAMG